MSAQGFPLGNFLPVANSLGTSFTGPPAPTWIQPVAHSQSLRLMDSLSQLKLLQILPKVSPLCLGRVLRKAPSLLLLSAIDSSLLIAVVSFSQTLQPDVWANYPQQSFPTALQ